MADEAQTVEEQQPGGDADPAPAADTSEVVVPAAVPVLPTQDEAMADLAEHPGRVSALSRDGIVCRP